MSNVLLDQEVMQLGINLKQSIWSNDYNSTKTKCLSILSKLNSKHLTKLSVYFEKLTVREIYAKLCDYFETTSPRLYAIVIEITKFEKLLEEFKELQKLLQWKVKEKALLQRRKQNFDKWLICKQQLPALLTYDISILLPWFETTE